MYSHVGLRLEFTPVLAHVLPDFIMVLANLIFFFVFFFLVFFFFCNGQPVNFPCENKCLPNLVSKKLVIFGCYIIGKHWNTHADQHGYYLRS